MNHFMTSSSTGGRVCILNPPDDPLPLHDALSVSPTDSTFSIPSDTSPTAKHPKLHQCSECGKLFSSSSHRSRHLKVHSGQKSHQCPFPDCGMSCVRHDNLIQHFRIHLPKAERKRDIGYIRYVLAQMHSSAIEIDDAYRHSSSTSPSLVKHASPSAFYAPPMILSSPSSFSAQNPSPTLAEDAMSSPSSQFFSSAHSPSASLPWEMEGESEGHSWGYRVSFVRGE